MSKYITFKTKKLCLLRKKCVSLQTRSSWSTILVMIFFLSTFSISKMALTYWSFPTPSPFALKYIFTQSWKAVRWSCRESLSITISKQDVRVSLFVENCWRQCGHVTCGFSLSSDTITIFFRHEIMGHAEYSCTLAPITDGEQILVARVESSVGCWSQLKQFLTSTPDIFVSPEDANRNILSKVDDWNDFSFDEWALKMT